MIGGRISVWTRRAVHGSALALGLTGAAPRLAFAQSTAPDTSFAVSRNGVIDISMRSGRLVVRGSDRATAELRSNGNDYQVRSGGVGVVLAVNESTRGRNERSFSGRRSDRGDVTLDVPRGTKVIVHGMTVDVDVADVAGDVEVQVYTGDVTFRALSGRAIATTVAGDVDAMDMSGDLRLSTVSGDISVRASRGAVELNTTSGDADISIDRISRLQFNSVTGDLVLAGALADDARLQVTTHSGDVTMRLPAGAAGQLEVSTFSGEVSGGTMTLMPGSLDGGRRGERGGSRYEFGGGGSARIAVSTFNGDITLIRGAGRGRE
jgi:hypothetical protein